MPKGLPQIASNPPEVVKERKIGKWWFGGYQVTPPPWRPAPPDWEPTPEEEVAIRIDLTCGGLGYSGLHGPVPATEWVQLVVCWRPGGSHPYSVTLFGNEGVAVGPKILAKFPWKTWLAVADGALRQTFHPEPALPDMFSPEQADGVNLRRRANRGAKAPDTKRPGKAGHGDDFYLDVAERYRELRMQGSTSPTRDIGEQTPPPIGPVSRSTAASWVRIAREKGFLAPGRRGRPGG